MSVVLDNNKIGAVGEYVKENTKDGSVITISSPIFTVYAFEELRKVLEKSGKFKFLFNEPTFIKRIIANDKEVKEFELQMHQRERNVSEFNLEIGLLKRIIVSHKSVNATSLNDWLEVAEKMNVNSDLLSKLKKLHFYTVYGTLKIENGYIDGEQLSQYGMKELRINEIEDEVISIFEDSSEFEKLKYFLAFQRVYVSAWKSTNLEYINPLFKRIENSLNSLEKVIDLVDNIDDSYTFMNIISLVDANQEITRLIPMLFSKMIYDEHKEYVTSCKTVTKTKHLIIDEAHNILNGQIRRNSDDWQDYRLGIFEEIIKEGRKFGFFLTIASQRPSDISPTIMSQIHNYIIHRLVNDNDLNMLINTMPTLDKFSFQMIPSLGQGEAVITGNAIKVPILVKVNKEKVIRPKSDDIELTNLWDDVDDYLSLLLDF